MAVYRNGRKLTPREEEDLENEWEDYLVEKQRKQEQEMLEIMIMEDEYEDRDTWQKTKQYDDHVLDTRFYSKDDYGYGDVDYEDDPD